MESIRELKKNNEEFSLLVLGMRSVLNSLNRTDKTVSEVEAIQEADSYFTDNRKVFIFEKENESIGFSVIKIEDGVCWLDWLYVKSEFQGVEIADQLFDHAEKFAEGLGNDQLYIWVHLDNHRMLKFLKKKGYDVLNLLEVKKVKPDYKNEVTIFNNTFRY